MKIYTIYDAITVRFWARLMILENDNHAKRIFQQSIQKDQTLNDNPGDYTLYRIGAYDDVTGIPIGHDPVRVQSGNEALQAYEEKREKIEALQTEIEQLNESPGGTA